MDPLWMCGILSWWKIGLVGGVGIGRRGVILKVINNIAKTHSGGSVVAGVG